MTEQPDWLKAYVAGMTNPQRWYVMMENDTVAVIARPGERYWSGLHHVYAPATQWLVTKGSEYWLDRQRTVWHGRVTQLRRDEMAGMMAARERS